MTEPKQEETFKVVDRRMFTESGELRDDAVAQEKRAEEAAKKAEAKIAPKAADSAAPGAETPLAEAIPSSRSFQMLVDFLTRNAAAMLGGMADPRTGQPFLDIEGAREMIDMLDALREKTLGNLSKEDEQLLLEVIGSLKLSFMEISKAAAEAMAKKQKGGK